MVLVTRYRRNLFNEGIFAYIEKKLAEVTEHYPLIKIKIANQDKDHIHMMVSVLPTMVVGKAVGVIKHNTAREMFYRQSLILFKPFREKSTTIIFLDFEVDPKNRTGC